MLPSPTQSIARLLSPILLGWVAGVALQLQQNALWTSTHYVTLIAGAAFLLALLLRLRHHPTRMLATFVAVALLGYASTGLRATWFMQQALDPALEGKDLLLTGSVSAMPQISDNSTRFRFAVENATLDGTAVRLPPQLSLSWYGPWQTGAGKPLASRPAVPASVVPELKAGERWQIAVRLRAPHGARNPHGFDYELWLWEQGLQATGYVRTGKRDPQPQRLVQTWAHPVELARQQVRDAIVRRAPPASAATHADDEEPDAAAGISAAAMNAENAAAGREADEQKSRAMGIVAALVTGDQQAINRSDWDVFRATGVAHLMSISGLHITLFAWLAALALRALWRASPRLCLAWPAQHAGLTGGLLLATAYAVFSGWGVPAQRTILMLATVAALNLSARSWPWPYRWMLACAVVVLVDPWALLQAGFWLSFVAVGVLFAGGEQHGEQERKRLWQRGAGLLREQMVITLALAPLTLLLFGQVSVVGLLANLLAIPWVTLVVTPLALLGVVWAPLWDAAAQAVLALNGLLVWLAAFPLATVTVAQAPLWAGLFAVLGGVLLVLRLPWALRFAALPLLLPALLWQAPRPVQGEFEMLAADIGQGNAVLVRTATHALLYDTGPRYANDNDAGQRVLVPLLRALDVRLNRLVLSHRDSDHTGGAAAVLAAQPSAGLLSSVEAGHALLALREGQRCEAGQSWTWDGVLFEVLHPQAGDYERAQRSNALSCVLRIHNGRQTVLLTGDIERQQEAQLLAAGAVLRADVLLVPHHGSKTSSSAVFLDAVAPRLALVQAGYRNRFAHPATDVVARYEERLIPLTTSAHCGAARWHSAQPQQWQCEREVQRRYWHHRPDTKRKLETKEGEN